MNIFEIRPTFRVGGAFAGFMLLVIAGVLATRPCLAQCRSWVPGPLSYHDGIEGDAVEAITTWDDDANPATPGLLIVAGRFSSAGGIPVNNIAAWDGRVWRALGTGLTYASGGTPQVLALAIFEGDLIAGGAFNRAGGATVESVARWDGSTWQAMGAPGPVGALATHQGVLYSGGGTLLGVRNWTGSAWSAADTTCNGSVDALCSYGNSLYAGGGFTVLGGVAVNRVARRGSPTWQPLGTGVGGGSFPGVRSLVVNALTNRLVVAGRFTTAGSSSAANIAEWSGTSWIAMGSGLGTPGVEIVYGVTATGVGPQQVVAVHSNTSARRVSAWNGSSWSTIGTLDSDGFAMHNHDPLPGASGDESIVAAGRFTRVDNDVRRRIAILDGNGDWQKVLNSASLLAFASAGGVTYAAGDFVYETPNGPAHNLLRWDGASVAPVLHFPSSVAEGTNGPVRTLRAVLVNATETDLYIGGDFTTAGSTAANRIARLRTSSGSASATYFPMGQGFNGTVHAIEQHNGSIYAGGAFTQSGGTNLSRVARWDGAAWRPLNGFISNGVNGTVYALRSFDGNLYVGGAFTGASGFPSNRVALWDGSGWNDNAVGDPGITGSAVHALIVDGTNLIAGGTFSSAGGVPSNAVARWNGGAWSAMSGLTGTVFSLARGNGLIYAGGTFSIAGGPLNHVATFDGSSWMRPDPTRDPDSGVRALIFRNTELQAGGDFSRLSSSDSAIAPGWARLIDYGVPEIISQPVPPGSVCPGGNVSLLFVVSPTQASGYTYRWRRDGVMLANGPTPHGSVVSGVTTPTLVISDIRPQDAGSYVGEITRASCATIVSNAAIVTVGGPACCIADVDDGTGTGTPDGGVTIEDLLYYLNIFDAGLPRADVDDGSFTGTPDGGVTIEDLLYYLARFDAGC